MKKTIIITGATSGIGLETTRLLADKGYCILAVGHSTANCEKADRDIRFGIPDADISWFAGDLMQQREVVRVAGEIKKRLNENGTESLYALINNAGCTRSRYMTTEDGYEQQFALNHLAGFRLTHELLPYLLKEGGRVIMTSSESHKNMKVRWSDVMMRKHYNPLLAYKQSKLCNMLFALGLSDRYGAKGLHAYGVDPGLVNTAIGNKTTGIVDFVWKFRKRFGVHPSVSAQDFLYLCEQCEPPAGLYFHRGKSKKYNKQVTTENATRLFKLSERLCGIRYE